MTRRCLNKGQQLLIIISAFLFFTTYAHASLINSDFSDGFNGWNGFLETEDSATGYNFEDELDPSAFPSNFTLMPNGVELTPTLDGDVYTYVVGLFQDFTFGPLEANTRKILSLSATPFLGDEDLNDPSFSDFFNIVLRNKTSGEERSLLTGGDFDISDWAEDELSLEFSISDIAGDINSTLALSNIELSDQINDVPEPQVFGLALLIMIMLRVKRT